MDKEYLTKIGKNVASLWGAECYDFKVSEDSKVVTFYCIEHGEKFATDVALPS